MTSTDSDKELPPTTVPEACQIYFQDLPEGSGSSDFMEHVRVLVVECGRFMDLQLLDGLTIGMNYASALDSVALGYESEVARQYTNAGGLLGVGKTLRVRREGKVKCHVVIDAGVLGGLFDAQSEMFWPCANIVAHELAHVAVDGWLELHSPGLLLSSEKGDWPTVRMRDAAHTIWQEYAACRVSARIGDCEFVAGQYTQSLDLAIEGAWDAARLSIESFRGHQNTSQLFSEVGGALGMPMKMAGYLLGHLDGWELEVDLPAKSKAVASSGFAPHFEALHAALREAWSNRLTWCGLEGVDGIVGVLLEVFRACGVDLQLRDEGSQIFVVD